MVLDALGFNREIEKVQRAGQELGKTFQAAGKTMRLAGAAITAGVTTPMTALIGKSTMAAARVDELDIVIEQLGKSAGYADGELQRHVQAVQAMGIEAASSREIVAKFVTAQLDSANAAKIARVAQDQAVIAGENSTETTNRLTDALITGNQQMFRSLRMNIDLTKAYEETARQLGKNVDQLTETEKIQARVNAVTEYGATIQGTYEAAMGDSYKQMGSFKRYLDDIFVALGQYFTPALNTAVFAIADLLKGVKDMVSEGGSLEGVLEGWGEKLQDAAKWIEKFVHWLLELDPWVIKLGLSFAGVLAVLGPLLVVGGQVLIWAGNLATALPALGISLGGVGAAAGGASAGLAGVGSAAGGASAGLAGVGSAAGGASAGLAGVGSAATLALGPLALVAAAVAAVGFAYMKHSINVASQVRAFRSVRREAIETGKSFQEYSQMVEKSAEETGNADKEFVKYRSSLKELREALEEAYESGKLTREEFEKFFYELKYGISTVDEVNQEFYNLIQSNYELEQAMLASMAASDEHMVKMWEMAGAADDAESSMSELAQRSWDVANAVSGWMSKYEEGVAPIRERLAEVGQALYELTTQTGTLTAEQETELASLRDEYGNLRTSIKEAQDAHREATNAMVFDLITQQMAVDGLTANEVAVLMEIGTEMGVLEEGAANMGIAISEALSTLEEDGSNAREVVSEIKGIIGETTTGAGLAQTALDNMLEGVMEDGELTYEELFEIKELLYEIHGDSPTYQAAYAEILDDLLEDSNLAMTDIGEIERLLALMHGKTYETEFNVTINTIGGSLEDLMPPGGQQHGGPVSAHTPYIVGEAGPELFVPATAGMIISHSELQRYVAADSDMVGAIEGARAFGGSVAPHKTYVVGERGPELFIPSVLAQPNQEGASQSGGDTYTYNLTMPTTANPGDVAMAFELLEAYGGNR